MDNIDLQIKKLHGHWTAHHFTVSITSKADVDNIRSRFEKCDKKSKMKILLSFVNMDLSLRATLAHPLKRLLKMASLDKDEWVQIVAGLVDDKLFSDPDEEIRAKCQDTLAQSANRVVQHLLDQVIFDDKDVFAYFEPLTNAYFTTPVEEDVNPHFTFTGPSAGPDFIEREQKILEANLSQDKKRAEYVTLMHSNISSRNTQLPTDRTSSTSSSSSSGGQSFLRGSSSAGGAARRTGGGIKSISLNMMQEMKAKEKEQKEREKEEMAMKKDKKRKTLDGQESTSKVSKLAADQTATSSVAQSSSPLSSLRSSPTSSSSVSEGKSRVPSTSASLSPTTPTPTPTAAPAPAPAPAPASAASTTTLAPAAPSASAPLTPADQVKKVRDEIHSSTLVSEEDKRAVDKFFDDKEALSGAMASSPSSSAEAQVRSIKFQEDEVIDSKTGEKKIRRVILELTVQGTNYSYRKIQKTIKNKN